MQYLWDKFLFVVCSKWCCARSTALSSECILAYAWAQPEELSLPSFPQLTSCESSAYQPASFNAVSLCSFKLCCSSAASWVASIIVTSTWDGSPGFTHKTSLLSNCLRTALLTPYLYLHISSEAQWLNLIQCERNYQPLCIWLQQYASVQGTDPASSRQLKAAAMGTLTGWVNHPFHQVCGSPHLHVIESFVHSTCLRLTPDGVFDGCDSRRLGSGNLNRVWGLAVDGACDTS